jgi:truncated hemoglobin YjbI
MQNINAYYIKIQTRENVEKLFHYFYDGVDESMYLTRKYKKFVEGLQGDQKDTEDYWSHDLPL